MSDSKSVRRMIENEVVFRNHNESVQKNFAEIKGMAEESNQEYLVKHDDTPLHFYCECSDENCRKRILLAPSEYAKIHKNRNRFIVIDGHETNIIERIVRKRLDFSIVEKHTKPPEDARTLQPTGVDNS